MKQFLHGLVHTPGYLAVMAFLAWYPLVTALYWVPGSLAFFGHREGDDDGFYDLDEFPFVSVLVAAHNEEAIISQTVTRLRDLGWPAYEVGNVDDGSRVRRHQL